MGVFFQYQQRADPIQFGTAPATPTQFDPEYPDLLRRPAIRAVASWAPAFFFAFALAGTNVPPLGSWQPQYPDRAPGRAGLHVSAQPALAQAHGYTFDPAFRLDPSYPAFAHGPRGLHPSLLPPLAQAPGYTFDPAQRVDPSYPDRARGPQGLHASQPQAVARDPFVVDAGILELGWAPSWPDFARGLQRLQQATALDPFPRPDVMVPPLTWQPNYPDRAPGRARAAEFQAFDLHPSPIQPPLLSWAPSYPDRALGPQALRTAAQQAVARHPQPIDAPLRSWAPSYPDFARGRQVHASRVPALFYVRGIVVIADAAVTRVYWNAEGLTLVAFDLEDVTLVTWTAP